MATVDSSFLDYRRVLDPDGELPHPDAVCDWFEEPSAAEQAEIERWERMSDEERLAELLADPDVQVVMEAVEGMPIGSE